MATSRTGTSVHRHWRRRVLARGQANGVVYCPDCGVELDYVNSKRPNSAEPDHIVPFARGGRDEVDNGRVVCRHCNQSRGAGNIPHRVQAPARQAHGVGIAW